MNNVVTVINDLLFSPTLNREPAVEPAGGWGEDWGRDPSLAPPVPAKDRVIVRLPGRITGGADFRDRYFLVTANLNVPATYIRVSRGSVCESFGISPYVLQALPQLSEEQQFQLVNGVYSAMKIIAQREKSRAHMEFEDAVLTGRVHVGAVDGERRMRIESVEEQARRLDADKRTAEALGPRGPVVIASAVEPFL